MFNWGSEGFKSEVLALTKLVQSQNTRLSSLERKLQERPSTEPVLANLGACSLDPRAQAGSHHFPSGSLSLPPPIRDDPTRSKMSRVEFEKERSRNVVLEELPTRGQPEASVYTGDSSDTDLLGIKKLMPDHLRDECSMRTAHRLKQAGSTFPEPGQDSNLSGMESDARSSQGCRRRRKVKSGAEIMTRPVVKRETWPHTIANEEDGEGVTSENITLASFLTCYTYLMTVSKGLEYTGRPHLLHNITRVLKCLPWTEARLFHNLVMNKLEQGRIRWDTDFTILANQFMDNKVRLLLKSKTQSSSYGSTAKSGNQGQRRSYNNRSGNGKSTSAYALVCYQWNEGTCTYGDKCKRWHVCRTCAESGKPGEKHKSSTHSHRGKQGESQP